MFEVFTQSLTNDHRTSLVRVYLVAAAKFGVVPLYVTGFIPICIQVQTLAALAATTATTFTVANASAVLTSKTLASSGLASVLSVNAYSSTGDSPFTVIDWGLPFFFGRSIYFGFEDRTSSLGKGPYYGL